MLLPGPRVWPSHGSITACAGGLMAVGLGVAGSAAWTLGNQMRLHPIPPIGAALRTDGPYRLMRHPMYVGMLLAAVGVALLRARGMSILALVGMVAVLSSKATVEEQQLLRRFRLAYGEYSRGTRRVLPTTPWIPNRGRS